MERQAQHKQSSATAVSSSIAFGAALISGAFPAGARGDHSGEPECPAEDRPLPIQLTRLVARCKKRCQCKGAFCEGDQLPRSLAPAEGQSLGRRPPKLLFGLWCPAGEMPGPAGFPARITFPARRTRGTCRLLLGASTAMKRHRGFCQKTKRQRQSWGWGKLSAAQEDPCRGCRMLPGSTAAIHPHWPPRWHPLARHRESRVGSPPSPCPS